MDLTDIYRTFYPNTKEYTFFSVPHGNFSKIGHILNHKASLKRHKKIEISLILFRPPWIKIGLEQQQKAYKFMETEQLYIQ